MKKYQIFFVSQLLVFSVPLQQNILLPFTFTKETIFQLESYYVQNIQSLHGQKLPHYDTSKKKTTESSIRFEKEKIQRIEEMVANLEYRDYLTPKNGKEEMITELGRIMSGLSGHFLYGRREY